MSRPTEPMATDERVQGALTLEPSTVPDLDAGTPDVRTHERIDVTLSGEPVELGEGRAKLRWWALDTMRADASGLVHGGFVFSLADHAAMLAINHPHVVLGASECRFLAPVCVGETLEAVATLAAVEGKKHQVDVSVRRADVMAESDDGGTVAAGDEVFRGRFTCFVPPRHVLDAAETAQ